ncbi:MAG TPA: diacylglycerol kinase family protein, partial [Anaeromyxobacteraceae bacterium]|nr:diacylglycerol kinase family protein [Anaeromyxobacteraceae bacterium]
MNEARAVLVVNAQARQGDELFEHARAALAQAGVHLAAAHPLHDPDALRPVLRDELARGATHLIVGGGDGTLSCAAGLVAGSAAVMSILPLGTANDFARSLHVPRELEAACRVAAHGAVREVDVALALRQARGERTLSAGRPFLNAASFGVSSGLARRLAGGELKKRAGPLAYPAAAAAEAAAHQPFRLRLDADGERAEL